MDRTVTYVAIPLVVLVAGGLIQFARPIPKVEIQPASSQIKLPGEFSVDFPPVGQMAVGEESLGVISQTPHEEPVAIASLTKIMTAYLLLQAQPLKPGEDGPVTTITQAEVQEYQKDRASGDSVVRVEAGERITERQLLEGLLLPSGDNIATLIADQVAGSESAFVQKMNAAARALDMTQTTYADAAGVDPATVSTAHDQLLIAQAAMQDRTFREVVREPQADLPVAGRVFNVDFMVGKQGITGIKTGSTLEAGSCFVGSYPISVDGNPHILLGAILGQQSLKIALTTDTQTLHQVASQFQDYPIPSKFALTTPWGQQSALDLPAPLSVFGYRGLAVDVEARPTQTKLPIAAGSQAASLTVTAGSEVQTLGLTAAQAITKPNFLWRLYR